MKRLLLIFSLMIPAWLYSCAGAKPPVPTPSQVIEAGHEAIRDLPITQVPAEEFELANPVPPAKPIVRKHQVKPNAPMPHPAPVRRPHAARKVAPAVRPPAVEAPLETLPPQQGVICLFPFNMIPTCTPEPAGRMP